SCVACTLSSSSLARKLRGVEMGVEAAQGQKLVVPALFDHAPLLEHDDEIGLLYGGEAMGDHERRAARGQLLQCILNQRFRLAVHTGRRLVQQENLAGVGQCAGEGYELPFSLGQRRAPLVELMVESLRQTIYDTGEMTDRNGVVE